MDGPALKTKAHIVEDQNLPISCLNIKWWNRQLPKTEWHPGSTGLNYGWHWLSRVAMGGLSQLHPGRLVIELRIFGVPDMCSVMEL